MPKNSSLRCTTPAGLSPEVEGRCGGSPATLTGPAVSPLASAACGSEWASTPSTRLSRAFISGSSYGLRSCGSTLWHRATVRVRRPIP
jgi:hypothetical protein